MLKDIDAMRKLNIEDSTGFHLRCFNYSYSENNDLFKISNRFKDIVDILKIYEDIDTYFFENKNLNGLITPEFKTKLLFKTTIDNSFVDVYSISDDKDFISVVFIHQVYGIILVNSVYPNGNIDLIKFKNKKINFTSPTLIRLDSLLYENHNNIYEL